MIDSVERLKKLYKSPFIRTFYHKNPITRFLKRKTERDLKSIFSSQFVLNGPFKGMNYPLDEARCSAYFPKLIGCYESELHGVFDKLKQRSFSQIIDIGCAEGYYAVGLASSFPSAITYAYDIDAIARELTYELAAANNINFDKFKVEDSCNTEALIQIKPENALVISDCEGFEIVLFNEVTIPLFKNSFLIIECHDQNGGNTCQILKQRFSKTHSAEIITSISDFEKIKSYNYITNRLSSFKRWYLYAERRETLMEWLILEPLK